MTPLGTLYLIPVMLGDESPATDVLPATVARAVSLLDDYVVENSKVARKFIKAIYPEKVQSTLNLFELNKHTDAKELKTFIQPLLDGKNMGLMSDAGCPGVADPGAVIVAMAHEKGIKVVPLVGPSSILLSLMGSGMNGQSFTFNGYLPIDKGEKKTMLKNLEKWSFERDQSQIFIETPYRNNQLIEEMVQILQPSTLICVACDLTLPTEVMLTKPVSFWKKHKIDLHKRPCIFIIHKK
ncbi:SAM-dependent methyltransferase [Flavobacterium sp. xlx-214]|uniref:SAM-dependent methyltransferase n=1 Tax=unclassified Flavobacterium TaxID=196869 RepID=UPI0013D284A5|nr:MULTISPECIES: SAM-dependent methyltransferase [unclassified Flavobacterium]MBA5791259.1 SAM-dependent methyltransferase [Flavobacterium sp. xlx-221]QMI83578.1 SAM-dependent methyltransferase [Flavobacterium sp. xlx-214]